MSTNEESLQIVADDDLPKLRDEYQKFLPRTTHVYTFLNCIIRWKKKRPNCATVLAPHGKWERGTFIVIQESSCYSCLFLCTLEEDCESLFNALTTTNKIEWNKLLVLYAVQKNQFPRILQALQTVEFPIHHSNYYDVWWIPKNTALNLDITNCPSEVYVKELETNHVAVINSHWPSKFPGSEEYLATFIELNGGFGVFLKSCNTLVAWILQNQTGLGALQTVEEHRRKGYGGLVTKHMARKIAEDGEDPSAIVLQTNVASQAMFQKLGFVIVESVVFTEAEIQW